MLKTQLKYYRLSTDIIITKAQRGKTKKPCIILNFKIVDFIFFFLSLIFIFLYFSISNFFIVTELKSSDITRILLHIVKISRINNVIVV